MDQIEGRGRRSRSDEIFGSSSSTHWIDIRGIFSAFPPSGGSTTIPEIVILKHYLFFIEGGIQIMKET